MNEYLQLAIASLILLISSGVVIRHLVEKRRAACTGSCSTCPMGGNKTGEESCEHASSQEPELTSIRGRSNP